MSASLRLAVPWFALAVALAASPAVRAQEPAPAAAAKLPNKIVVAGDDVRWLANWALRECEAEADAAPFRFADLLATEEESAEKPAEKPAPPELLVLCFWSRTCPWQEAWNPELAAIARDYAGQRVRVLAIDSNEDELKDPAKIRSHKRKLGLTIPILLDDASLLAARFGARTTPHIYLIDRAGSVLYTGAVDNDARRESPAEERQAYLRNALDAALAGQEIALSSTPPKGCSIKFARPPKNDKVPFRR